MPVVVSWRLAAAERLGQHDDAPSALRAELSSCTERGLTVVERTAEGCGAGTKTEDKKDTANRPADDTKRRRDAPLRISHDATLDPAAPVSSGSCKEAGRLRERIYFGTQEGPLRSRPCV